MLISTESLQLLLDEEMQSGLRLSRSNGYFYAYREQDGDFAGTEDALEENKYVDRDPKKGIRRFFQKMISPEYPQSGENILKFIQMCSALSPKPRILVIGGGELGSGSGELYESETIELIGLDIYPSPYVNLVCDAHKIPLQSGIFDGVMIQAVLEHVFDPAQVVSEIRRVLKPGGYVYAETPFLQQVHEGAYDFTRFTESGHRYLFRDFEEVNAGVIAGAGTQLLWSIEYFFRGVFRSWAIGKGFKLLFFWVRFFDLWIPDSYNRDSASCVYFTGRNKGPLMTHEELIAFYSRER